MLRRVAKQCATVTHSLAFRGEGRKGVKIVSLRFVTKHRALHIQIKNKIEFQSNVIHWRQQINKI